MKQYESILFIPQEYKDEKSKIGLDTVTEIRE